MLARNWAAETLSFIGGKLRIQRLAMITSKKIGMMRINLAATKSTGWPRRSSDMLFTKPLRMKNISTP